jgi:hypothetical protein
MRCKVINNKTNANKKIIISLKLFVLMFAENQSNSKSGTKRPNLILSILLPFNLSAP